MADTKESLEKAFYSVLEEGYNEESGYDYLVLFSGGKDSTYLAHKLKQAKGGRVCLFTVDNGIPPNLLMDETGNNGSMSLFTPSGSDEKKSIADVAKKTAKQLDMDLFIYQPPQKYFLKYYNFLILEDKVKEIDSNPLCFLCGRYFMALGMNFAEKHKIPFVFYGATPMQVNQGNIPKTLREAKIFDMVSKKVLMGNYKKLQTTQRYQNDPIVKQVIDTSFRFSSDVRLMFPFLYLDYNIDEIKTTLEKEYGWENPTSAVSNDQYITSGCPMVLLFGLLAKKRSFGIHEIQQISKDYSQGILSNEAYDYNKDMFDNLMEGKIEPQVEKLIKLLDLEDALLK
ncbi:MAG: hypothetical protein JXB88_13835 [Spirochaetales bacterium]|nr:hypothetical protein [Spirochaetales bacterium]